jgi:hypothetical protein
MRGCVARLRFVDECGDADIDLAAVGGICSTKERYDKKDVKYYPGLELEGIRGEAMG